MKRATQASRNQRNSGQKNSRGGSATPVSRGKPSGSRTARHGETPRGPGPHLTGPHDPRKNTLSSALAISKPTTYPKHWRQVAGNHAIQELLRVRPGSVKVILLQNNWSSSADLRSLVEEFKNGRFPFEEKSDSELQKICPSHQGAVAFTEDTQIFDYARPNWKDKALVLALDGVEDPHNLGAIMRTSWLMDVSGIIIPSDRAVGLSATVHKVACGGVEHVPLAQINNFSEPFATLKKAGFWVFGMSHKAKQSLYDLKMPDKVLWVMGAEDKGLRIPTERACDELVSIPQLDAKASYNVSVATALALAETKRQWSNVR